MWDKGGKVIKVPFVVGRWNEVRVLETLSQMEQGKRVLLPIVLDNDEVQDSHGG